MHGKVEIVMCVRKSKGLIRLKGRFGAKWVHPQLGMLVSFYSINVGSVPIMGEFAFRWPAGTPHSLCAAGYKHVDPTQQNQGPTGKQLHCLKGILTMISYYLGLTSCPEHWS